MNEYGMSSLFLLEGEEKALLIDTGTGSFDIPELVRSLTDKPLLVALTHGHLDHAGGIGQFDEVHLRPEDWVLARSVTLSRRKEYAARLLSLSGSLFSAAPEDLIPGENCTVFRPMPESFDLGKRKVIAVPTPGHTPGGASFICQKERLLFSGDACNSHMLLTGKDIPGFREENSLAGLISTCQKLISLKPLYDRNFNGHVSYGSSLDVLPQQESVPYDLMRLAGDILSGKEKGHRDGEWSASYGAVSIRIRPDGSSR